MGESLKWHTNKPRLDQVLKMWTTPKKTDVVSSDELLKSRQTQKWRGLSIQDFGRDRGQGKK